VNTLYGTKNNRSLKTLESQPETNAAFTRRSKAGGEDQKEYDEKMQEASGIISEISGWVKEVKVKYEPILK